MMTNQPKQALKLTRIYTKKALKKAPAQHFAVGVAKSTASVTFCDLVVHHKIPDIVATVSDASIVQAANTVLWLVKELS